MTRREFEQAASLREELAVLKSGRNQNPRTEDMERLLKEAESLPDRLPDPKARIIAQKVLEHGAPIPWKQIVAELGYRWTVGKARYAYARVCALCFERKEK